MFKDRLDVHVDTRTEQQTKVDETPEKDQGERLFVSPKDFYEEMKKRSDVKEILAKLAQR